MEDRYLHLRKQLEELGYHQYLKIECVPLVEKLVSDLIQTTDSLRKYMKISKDVITERDNLLLGAEPYKCDNAKLVKECNELHLAFLQFREQHEKLQKDLKRRISTLERQKIDSDLVREKLQTEIKNLELQLAHKTSKSLNSESSKLGLKPTLKTTTMSTLPKCRCGAPREKSGTMSLAEDKISSLMKDNSKLKEEKLELTEANLAYRDQINSRDKEIQRLLSLLEGGRPVQALNQDCCYKDVEAKMIRMQEDIEILQRGKRDLENRLKEAVIKQHEAMKRALSLAERNKVLEKEMRDIDQIALAVEAECNTTAKSNANKVCRLQEKVHESILQIQQLEKELADLKRDKQELVSDYEAVKTEKRHLQTVLETALEEKKRLNERLNRCSIIEHDLNMEIDRLMQTSAAQKQKIVELECQLMAASGDISLNMIRDKHKKKSKSPKKKKVHRPTKRKSPHRSYPGGDHGRVPDNTPATPTKSRSSYSSSPSPHRGVSPGRYSPGRVSPGSLSPERRFPRRKSVVETKTDSCSGRDTCVAELKKLIMEEICNKNVCLNHLKEIIGNEMDHIQSRANMSLDHLKNERDYYMKECQVLMEKMSNMCNKPSQGECDCKASKTVIEKEQVIADLEQENRTLSKEKHNLMTRLETVRDRNEDADMVSVRSVIRRLERERDLLKADIQRLEEERDGMRHRLNTMAEHHLQEKARLESMLKNAEEDVRKLEADRRDIIHTQGSRRATINNLQEECDMLREQLKNCQGEFSQQKAYHSQLKTLHEQTDRALADCQSQLYQLEKEMFMVQERLKASDNEKESANKEILNLKNELVVLKGSFAKIDAEKDSLLHNLDDKTEKLAALEEELKRKDMKITSMEGTLADMRRKVSDAAAEICEKEQQLRNATADLNRVQQDLETLIRARDMAYQENRRLQDDLAAYTADNKRTQNDLDIARRQVDDLRRQLQHYVAEVKRTEDLISQKEIERAEMLDQYRNLTQEATTLESNNHSLETEAAQTKVQLSVTLDHVNDLERRIESQETMIRGYEKQISDLTSQIARMEIQVVQYTATNDKLEAELSSMKELCLKLDRQKDSLLKQLRDNESSKGQIDRDISKLRRESAEIESNLEKERDIIANLESLLSNSRRESIEQRMLNQELQKEVQKFKDKVQDLESKLVTATEQLDLFQEKALEYSQQNKQLRREIANERFARARDDESKRSSVSVQQTLQNDNGKRAQGSSEQRRSFVVSTDTLHRISSPPPSNMVQKTPSKTIEKTPSVTFSTITKNRSPVRANLEKRNTLMEEIDGYSLKSLQRDLGPNTVSSQGDSFTNRKDNGTLDNAPGIQGFNKRVDSRSRSINNFEGGGISRSRNNFEEISSPTKSTATELGSLTNELFERVIRTATNEPAVLPTGAYESNNKSVVPESNVTLIQIARNKTITNVPSRRHNILSRTASVSSSTLLNEASVGQLSVRDDSEQNDEGTVPINSVSENIIDKNFDQACANKSNLGIVSSVNKLDSASQLTLSKPRKRVSLSYPTDEQQLPYSSISGALISARSNVLPNAPPPSLEILREKSSSRQTVKADHRPDPSETVSKSGATHDTKSSQSDPCECWKICTCRYRDANSSGFRNPATQVTCPRGHAITCVVANNGVTPKRYTASYSFSYDNLPNEHPST